MTVSIVYYTWCVVRNLSHHSPLRLSGPCGAGGASVATAGGGGVVVLGALVAVVVLGALVVVVVEEVAGALVVVVVVVVAVVVEEVVGALVVVVVVVVVTDAVAGFPPGQRPGQTSETYVTGAWYSRPRIAGTAPCVSPHEYLVWISA